MTGDRDVHAAFVIAKAVQRRHEMAGILARPLDQGERPGWRAFAQAHQARRVVQRLIERVVAGLVQTDDIGLRIRGTRPRCRQRQSRSRREYCRRRAADPMPPARSVILQATLPASAALAKSFEHLYRQKVGSPPLSGSHSLRT